jgi:hypothetical protein
MLIFSMALLGLFANANNPTKIDTKGNLKVEKPKSASQQQLEVFLSENRIDINFYVCLENIAIVIVNENEQTVYHQTVNSCVTTTFSINIQNLPAGWYKIIFTVQDGGFVEGWFEVK